MFSQNSYIPNITKTLPEGAELFREDIRVDEQLQGRMGRQTSRRTDRCDRDNCSLLQFSYAPKICLCNENTFCFKRCENSLSVIVMETNFSLQSVQGILS